MKRGWVVPLLAIAIALVGWISARSQGSFAAASSVLNSKHDFRVTSTTAIRSSGENDPCVFCHTPHNATPGPELWNHTMSSTKFPTYSSSTMMSTTGEIEDRDSSKLCLSCHDGTIALASTVNSAEIDFIQGPDYKISNLSSSNLAANASMGFSDDHPFAFTPNSAQAEYQSPANGDPVRLEDGKVQCVSCHNPHKENIDVTQGKFLVKSNQSSSLCLTCHNKTGWTGSVHQAPPDLAMDQLYTSAQGAHTGYIGVANNGCESCHRPHTASSGARLVKFTEERTCYKCHDGSVTANNVFSELTAKTYRHPVDITPSVHDAAEGWPGSQNPLPEMSASVTRHSECEDCHNPHEAKPASKEIPSQAPAVTAPITGVSGIDTAKAFQRRAANEYQICFKCHADSVNRPQLTDVAQRFGRYPLRQFNEGNPEAFNQRVEFTQGVSFHPVTRTNPMANVPSLRQPNMVASDGSTVIKTRPLNAATMIYCSDCHASDTNRTVAVGNTGATGPHGSDIPHLLERANPMEQPVPPTSTQPIGTAGTATGYTPGMYALCDKCHQVDAVIYADRDSFTGQHRAHIDQTTCSTCHDPHASKSNRLINFDLSIVGPSTAGPVQFSNDGAGHGSCTLMCHNHDHRPSRY